MAVEYVCGDVSEPFLDETDSVPLLVIGGVEDGTITGEMPDSYPFELQWVP